MSFLSGPGIMGIAQLLCKELRLSAGSGRGQGTLVLFSSIGVSQGPKSELEMAPAMATLTCPFYRQIFSELL